MSLYTNQGRAAGQAIDEEDAEEDDVINPELFQSAVVCD